MPDFVWIQQVIFPLAGMAMATFFGWQLFRTINAHLERKSGRAASGELQGLREEVDRLRALVESQDDTRGQIADLEERVEFAERVLARGRHGELERGRD